MHLSLRRQDTGGPSGAARPCIAVRIPTQRGTKPRGKCAGPGCRRYFGGFSTKSSILASPRFSSKSPIVLLAPVRLAPCVSDFAPALEPARCTEVLARPLLAAGSCSTLQRRCVCRPPWAELAFASAFVADFAPFPDPELHLLSSSLDLVPVEALLGLLSSSLDLVPVEALLGLLSSSLDLVPVEALPGLAV